MFKIYIRSSVNYTRPFPMMFILAGICGLLSLFFLKPISFHGVDDDAPEFSGINEFLNSIFIFFAR